MDYVPAWTHTRKVAALRDTHRLDCYGLYEKPLALEGDMVSCPKCGGVYPIFAVRVRSMTFDGRAVATDSDKAAYDATLIASQGEATVVPTSGGSVGAGKSVISQNDAARGCFQLVDDNTREPLSNHPYTLTSTDGQVITGHTDATGHTYWLNTAQASSLTFRQSGSPGTESAGKA